MTKRVSAISVPDRALRVAAETGLDRGDPYSVWAPEFSCLNELEFIEGSHQGPTPNQLKVGAWNLERGSAWPAAAEIIRAHQLDVVLLTEMDCGMSRSAQQHTTRELCQALGWSGVFAVEFVELGLGNPWELNRPLDDFNRAGLHGNAIISKYPILNPRLLRFSESDGSWWHRTFHEARLGGRIAISGEISTASGPVSCVVTHLENNTSPQVRERAINALLSWHTASEQACVLGGDFNTSTIDPTTTSDPYRLRNSLIEANPNRFRQPEAYEPLFERLADADFHWGTANTRDVTQRPRERGYPKPPLGRIDWLFTRFLVATDAQTTPAIDATGETISDHDLIQAVISVN